MSQPDKDTIITAYVRVCRDSRFTLEWTRAARLVGDMFGLSGLQVWLIFGDMDNMQRVAHGTHPGLALPRYGGKGK